MHYHNITKADMLNGEGLRVVLWLAGCSHYCNGCHNQITWDPNGGLEFTANEVAEILSELSKSYISGFTVSGGDSLYPGNREEVRLLCQYLKKECPDKNIWLYTGYLFEQVKDLPVMEFVDVVVDGPFVQELADVKYKWAGSTNQRIWRKVNGEWRVDENECNGLEERSTDTCCGSRGA